MRARGHWIVASLALLAFAAAAPAASAADHPFRYPVPRPTDHRPTDHPDPNRNAYTVPEAPQSPACTAHFCVHWVAEGIDAPSLDDANANGLPDYVERVQSVAEHVYSVENGKLGWQKPKSDGTLGGGRGKTDIYLSEIGGSLFGYATPDRGQANRAHRFPRHLYGYLVLDNDYDPFEFPGTTQLRDLEVTLAHEYNHILQFGYDAYQDAWFAESTAVWMEDQVYGSINDYLRYMPRWARSFDTPLTTSSIKEYGSAVWNHWLAHRYGRRLIRRIWAGAVHVKPAGFSVAAYRAGIRRAGPSDFSHDFARFARDVAEWRTGIAFGEGALYPDVPRQGGLAVDAHSRLEHLNHTTFRLLRVDASHGRGVVVDAVAPRGVAAGLALVGRIGSERQGRVVSRLRFAPRGGSMSVRLGRPGRFDRLTAVLVNADSTANGFSARRLDWNYIDDGLPFRVWARLAG
jgi:hypothetical protein